MDEPKWSGKKKGGGGGVLGDWSLLQPVDEYPQKWCTDSCSVLCKLLAAVQLCHWSICKGMSHLKTGFAQQVERDIRIKT